MNRATELLRRLSLVAIHLTKLVVLLTVTAHLHRLYSLFEQEEGLLVVVEQQQEKQERRLENDKWQWQWV